MRSAERRSATRIESLKPNTQQWQQILDANISLGVTELQQYFQTYASFKPLSRPDDELFIHCQANLTTVSSQPSMLHIVGPPAVGKDSVLIELGIPFVVSDTDRPMRENEIDGVTYNFISKKIMDERIAKGEYIEYTKIPADREINRMGIHKHAVQKVFETNPAVLAFRTNPDAFNPVNRYCQTNYGYAPLKLMMLPYMPVREYFEFLEKTRKTRTRTPMAKVEIEYTPALYNLDCILLNPREASDRPIHAAAALTRLLQYIRGNK